MAREPKVHDEAPSIITDHSYEPRGEWWSLCVHCGLAQAAHSSSTPEALTMKETYFATLPRAITGIEAIRQAERDRACRGGRVRLSYCGDDDE